MKKIVSLSAAVLMAAGAFAGSKPTSEKTALPITATSSVQKKAVTLYKSGSKYVCFYKLTLRKNTAYTAWLSGSDAAKGKIAIVSANPEMSTDWSISEPEAYFEAIACGQETRWRVSGEDWEVDWGDDWNTSGSGDWGGGWDDDFGKMTTPDSWTYYICIEGEKGAKATLNYVAKDKIPKGVAANPLVIKPTEKSQTKSLTDGFMSEDYYVQVKVTAGKFYRFGTTGGDSKNELSFADSSIGLCTTGDYPTWTKSHNGTLSLVSEVDQTLVLQVRSSKGYQATGKIRFFVEKQRTLAKHNPTTLKAGKTVKAKPGYLNKPGTGAFDMIVDEQLFKISAKKGKSYVVDTVGAKPGVPIVAYLYDSKGKVIQTNRSKGCGSPDVRLVWSAAKAGTYYVGVCEDQPILAAPKPQYVQVELTATELSSVGKSVKLAPVPGSKSSVPKKEDAAGSPVITLGRDCWYANCSFAVSSKIDYSFSVEFANAGQTETNDLTAAFYLGKVSDKTLVKTVTTEPGKKFTFQPKEDGMYYLQLSPAAGQGLDYSPVRVHSVGYCSDGTACGGLKVTLTGASGKWMTAKKGVQYASGATLILPATSKQKLYFTTVKDCTAPESTTVKVSAAKTAEAVFYYTDKWDPKDKSTKYATSWTVTSKTTKQSKHTLWKTDTKDIFAFTSKGYHYTFSIDGGKGDQVFTVQDSTGKKVYADKVTKMTRVYLPKSSKKYYLIVSHSTKTNEGGAYTLSGKYEDLGVVKFSASTYTAKDSATSVTLYATRTGKTDACRVKYTLKAGTAKAGENYVNASGYVSWKNGDKAKKKITVQLIPKTLPVKGKDLKFTVTLKDASTASAGDGLTKVRQAAFAGGKTSVSATVKIANSAKYKDAQAAYASVYTDKKATVKKDETSPLRSGTFFGLVRASGVAPTNGAPEYGAVTLTVTAGKTASADKLSAKVQVAGKSWSFATAAGEPVWDAQTSAGYVKTLRLAVGTQTNELTVTVSDGKASKWTGSVCTASLKLSIPDAAGGQEGIAYSGRLYRNNTKIQSYLDKAFKFDGYYTMSIVPKDVCGTDRGDADRGVPSGHGYLTVTLDNKGTAKVSGLLPDKSAVSASATACAVVADSQSTTGYSMVIPVYQADANGCLAAELRLLMQSDKSHLDGKGYKTVVDSSVAVVWNRDDGAAETRDGIQGWRMTLAPAGGWYDKLANLQGYYNKKASGFAVGTSETLTEVLLEGKEGYGFAAYPIEDPVDLVGNKFSVPKRAWTADSQSPEFHDLSASVNPCNVKISFNRATGVSSGSCSVWIEKTDAQGRIIGQEQIGGFSHFGVLTIDRDTRKGIARPLLDDTLIGGALIKDIQMPGHLWKYSIPFEVFEK